ncbi:MAG: hypothetical protein IPM82_11485 [Saprospiraceae bacterium]|nr:hypothetical protein [Saprospiraceae bacterium]
MGDAIITAILPYQADTQLVTTIKSGIFCYTNGNFAPWRTPHDPLFTESRIYSAGLLPDGKIAIGTPTTASWCSTASGVFSTI